MNVGELYNVFVCFVISLTSVIVFLKLRKIRKERRPEYSEALDYFSLCLGVLWGLIGTRKVFTLLDLEYINVFLFQWVSGPLNYIHLLPAFYYFGWSFFKNNKKIRLLFDSLFTIMILLTLYTFFIYGFVQGEVTYWGSHHDPNAITNKIFVFCVFVPAFIFIIINFLRHLIAWRKTGDAVQRQLFGFSIGFLIYALTGVVDALGIFKEWLIIFIRIAMMTAPLVFYLSATWETEK